jgi:uncharacterized protein (DUF934 family)
MPVVEEQGAGRQVIRLIDTAPVIVDDEWRLVRDEDEAAALLAGHDSERAIVPVDSWLGAVAAGGASALHGVGVWIGPDADFEGYASTLMEVPLIAVDFPNFKDGRGLSIGFVLRTRFGYRGEIRAVGDVLRDQLENMRRCGFDSFAVRADKNIHDALKGFSEISVRYQGMAGDPRPLFRRRDNDEDVRAS